MKVLVLSLWLMKLEYFGWALEIEHTYYRADISQEIGNYQRTVQTRSKINCAATCSKDDKCVAFSFDKTTGICSMSNESPNSIAGGLFLDVNLRGGYHIVKDLNFCYKLFFRPEKITWDDANGFCKNDSAHLATVDTPDKYNIIKQYAENNADGSISGAITFFIDGAEKVEEGQWLDWKNQELAWTLFYPGEPNNYLDDEDCLGLMNNHDYEMADIPCSKIDYGYYFFCEKELDKQP